MPAPTYGPTRETHGYERLPPMRRPADNDYNGTGCRWRGGRKPTLPPDAAWGSGWALEHLLQDMRDV